MCAKLVAMCPLVLFFSKRTNKADACVKIKGSGKTDEEGKEATRTCNSFWNPQDPIAEYDIDEFILGMSGQVTEREDAIITEDLRGLS